MKVIYARNVNDAYEQGLELLRREGLKESSRAGDVLVTPFPVATVYERPQERVLFDPGRDANPFFHLFESLWMLSGRNDARWLDRFVRDFSSRFAEDDGRQHGAYGYRWRHHFDMDGGAEPDLPDQLDTVVRLLRANPRDRRVVLTMWDPVADLGVDKRDVPCNLHVMPRVRSTDFGSVLDITVSCRSNDAIWGTYGANAVHFSVLQEYLAGRIGVGVGTYTQISNNFHVYTDILEKKGVPQPGWKAPYTDSMYSMLTVPIGSDWEHWDEDLAKFMAWTEGADGEDFLNDGIGEGRINPSHYHNSWFRDTADPLFAAHWCWKKGYMYDAFVILQESEGIAPDWAAAAYQWLERRTK